MPHGYLSEEEGENDEDDKPLSPSAAKEQLKIKEEQFERELKEKTHHIKPSLIGCCWSENLDEEPHVLKVLKKYAAMIVSEHNIISLALNDLGCDEDAPAADEVRSEKIVRIRPVNEDDVPVLLKILHGSTYSKVTIVKEFLMHIKQQSKNDDVKSDVKTDAKTGKLVNCLTNESFYIFFNDSAVQSKSFIKDWGDRFLDQMFGAWADERTRLLARQSGSPSKT